ncbi:unnamed protein product [Polarella glacialis]|uniref:Uncharacterized protein n=1 Tax=Polarella glacialis TaxID=89957 RepID=A0A813HKL5_POLGL|nr:unnamed protein product [Polarella glacialis]|eukprot:CAMPEP_0115079006 /NCGR_PEP_ID=MMETSP0227-20121206/17860_1 /TAXON_ID=89957 /ORGANISM="Polarella glacialis, Strain CCMP 1383" /LENGTH=1114 /DNA_ID=CAMNT_0002466445 /DNA_START=1195 /DNA_END=4539 /DNA_ORIENTATION=+
MESDDEDFQHPPPPEVTDGQEAGLGGEPSGSGSYEDEDEGSETSADNAYNYMDSRADSGEDTTAITEVQDQTFDEIRLPAEVVADIQDVWKAFLATASSREAAASAIYAAIFDSAPTLQSLFKTPRAVMAIRIMSGINNIVNNLASPVNLKISTETLGFQHLDLEVTVPRVIIFRDGIIDLFEMELGDRLTSRGKMGWRSVLNYVGGAFIYVRTNYSDRLKIIASSWAIANNHQDEIEAGLAEDSQEPSQNQDEDDDGTDGMEKKSQNSDETKEDGENIAATRKQTMKVPTTFEEMFMFNSAVMGFGNCLWMGEVLDSFNTMVRNVSNSYRLQEECDTLSLRLAKYRGTINLAEFKAVMLASLRSMVPKDWNSAHEVAWTWLWTNVERMIKALIGKPKTQEKALERFLMSQSEDNQNYFRRELYKRFFILAPAGQDFFKQSTTRLYWLADRVTEMTIEMYRDPTKSVENISGVGLRHVGYGVPTEFFAPYVTGAVEVVRSMTTDDDAEDGFRWSLSLIARILVRTINEGSTVVMRAINTNNAKQLRMAVGCAPRGKRAMWMLNITVGTQSISPLYWAIESGSLATANAMLVDLLTIRADRDNYYYGCNDLFDRHADILKRLSAEADSLLPTLLDGLVWRSRLTKHGQRRVNYYIKHLIMDAEGKFAQALEWLVENQDPKIICHPVVVLFSDLLWRRIAMQSFLFRRCWFLSMLILFTVSQAILPRLENAHTNTVQVTELCCRVMVYLGSLLPLMRSQVILLYKDVRNRKFTWLYCIPMPEYLLEYKASVSLALVLALTFMMIREPIFWCIGHGEGDFDGAGLLLTDACPYAAEQRRSYSAAAMFAMCMYWILVMDLTIFSTRISAYVLVCARVLPELGLFIFAVGFLIITFASSISALNHGSKDFDNIPKGALTLLEVTLGMYTPGQLQEIEAEGMLMMAVSVFIVTALIFLLSLLIAQLYGAYRAVYVDMVGYARLNRGKTICSTMASMSPKRWAKLLGALKFNESLEFNEGDIGLPGGLQVLEPSNVHATTVDTIRRFGGSTSPAMQWPEEEGHHDDDEHKYDKLFRVLTKISKNVGGGGSGGASKRQASGKASSLEDTSMDDAHSDTSSNE